MRPQLPFCTYRSSNSHKLPIGLKEKKKEKISGFWLGGVRNTMLTMSGLGGPRWVLGTPGCAMGPCGAPWSLYMRPYMGLWRPR